jgi:hypothetical protein
MSPSNHEKDNNLFSITGKLLSSEPKIDININQRVQNYIFEMMKNLKYIGAGAAIFSVAGCAFVIHKHLHAQKQKPTKQVDDSPNASTPQQLKVFIKDPVTEEELKMLHGSITGSKFQMELSEICQLFLGTTTDHAENKVSWLWSWIWLRIYPIPRANPITKHSPRLKCDILEYILFYRACNRNTGRTFPVDTYQPTIEHAFTILRDLELHNEGGLTNPADAVIIRCCGELLSRIMDEREEDGLEMNKLRFPIMQDHIATMLALPCISTHSFLGSLVVQKYRRLER